MNPKTRRTHLNVLLTVKPVVGLTPDLRKGTRRTEPCSFRREDNVGQGACLFHAVSDSLAAIGKKTSAKELRLLVCTHMGKHKSLYNSFWDGVRPEREDKEIKPRNFDAY